MKFNENLKELRLAKGVSQRDVAIFLGLTQKAYCFYELGSREPSIQTILKLCDFFEVSADFLLGRAENY